MFTNGAEPIRAKIKEIVPQYSFQQLPVKQEISKARAEGHFKKAAGHDYLSPTFALSRLISCPVLCKTPLKFEVLCLHSAPSAWGENSNAGARLHSLHMYGYRSR